MERISIKIISISLIATLLFQNASWASARGQEKENIQVPSVFNRIDNNKNWQYDEQVRIELALVLAVRQNAPFHVINDNIDRMYEGTSKKRIVDVLSPRDKTNNKTRQVQLLYGSRKGEILDLSLDEQDKKEQQQTKEKDIPGRTSEYDDQGRITKIYDSEAGIIWEEYEYQDDGKEKIYLYNPANGRKVLIKQGTVNMRGGEVSNFYEVSHEDPNGEFQDIGAFVAKEGETEGKKYLCVVNVRLEKNGQKEAFRDAGKTILRWSALKAFRERLELKFSEGYNPVSSELIKPLYKMPTLILTQDNWERNGGEVKASGNDKEYSASVLEQEYYFKIPGQSPRKDTCTIKVEKGTRKIIKADNWPPGYTARIEEERLKVYDEREKTVILAYFKRFFWQGLPDAEKIISMQNEEEKKRKEEKQKEIPERQTEHDSNGKITRVYDRKRRITWEEYVYDELGNIEQIFLYNPRSRKRIKLKKKEAFEEEDQSMQAPFTQWNIFQEEKGEYAKIGHFVLEGDEGTIDLKDISIPRHDKKGLGVGITVVRWLMHEAQREDKSLKVSDIYSPIIAGIIKDLYRQETIEVTQGTEKIDFLNKQELEKILLEQRYVFTVLGKDGLPAERKNISIEKGTGKIILTKNWPDYLKVLIEGNRAVGRDLRGNRTNLRYTDLFTFQGKPDEAKLVWMENKDEEQSLDDKMIRIMEKEAPNTKKWGPYFVDETKYYTENIIKPSEIRKTLDKWFENKDIRYFGREKWERAIEETEDKECPAFFTKAESETGELLGISYCHKGVFPFENGDVTTYLGDFSETSYGYRGKNIGEVLLAKRLERIVDAHPDMSLHEEVYVIHPAEDDEYADKGKRAVDFWKKRGFKDVYFSWYERLSSSEKMNNRYMFITAHEAQKMVDRVKRHELTERPGIHKQLKLFQEKPVQMSLFSKEASVSEKQINRLRTRTKWQKRQKKKQKKKTDPQTSLFHKEGLIREGSAWVAYEKADSVAKLYKETIKEAQKDLLLNQKREAKLRKFFLRYIKTADRGQSAFVEHLRAEDIADIFYLKEVYGFDLFGLIEKGKTKWKKKRGKKEDLYEFELDGEYCIRIRGYDSAGDKRYIGDAVCWTEDLIVISLDERKQDGGHNLGNFLIKIYMVNRWTKGDKNFISFIGHNEDPQNPQALKEAHETMGFEIVAKGEKVLRTLHGDIGAGIMTKSEAARIKGLNKYIWRVWSQRKLDRYFRMTKDLDQDELVEINEAFSESQKGYDKEILRKIQPEEIAEFIEEHLKEDKLEKKVIKKIIKKTGEVFKETIQRIKDYQEGKKTVPVDIIIDLALFPTDEKDLKGEIETWAYLVLLCRDLNNVNFIFEKGSRLTKGYKMTDALEEAKLSAPEEGKVANDLKVAIEKKAIFFDVDPLKIKTILNWRINPGGERESKDRIEIPITSVDLLKWIREEKNKGEDIGVNENQYPIGLEGSIPGINKKPILRNFEAALALGLMKAALVMVPQDENPEEKARMKRDMSIKIKKLYEILRPGLEIGEEAIQNMISHNLVRRLNRAIDFALPPIIRTNIEEIRHIREGLNQALQSA